MNKGIVLLLVVMINMQNVYSADLLRKYKIIGSRKPSLVNILTELETKLQTGGSLDTVLVFLDNLRASINEEQIRHDQLFTDQKGQCQEELDLRSHDVKDAEQVLNRATEQYENCSSSNKKASSELDNNLDNQKATDTDVKTLENIRALGAEQYGVRKQDHIDSLRGIQESLKILESFQAGGASLVQMSEISLRLIRDSVKLRTTNQMASISGIFAQMMTQNGGYLEVFERLKQFLTNLEQNLYKDLQKLQEEEDNAISEFDDRHTHLVDYFVNLKKTENELRDHITNMEICQDQQGGIIESAKGKKIRNSELFESANNMCGDFQAEYDQATAVRRQELDLVAKVKEEIIAKTADYNGSDSF